MADRFDLIVIGGGPGGYVAAIRAQELGLKTAVVERDKVGGTCLHRGCIPTKALLVSAEIFSRLKDAGEFGVEAEAAKFNLARAAERKRKVVEQLYEGVQFLLKKAGVTVYGGTGELLGSGKVGVKGQAGTVELAADHVILATGSAPKLLPGLAADGKKVLTSDDILVLEQIPKSLAIIGAGAIGVEFASFFSEIGTKVTLIEALPRVLPLEDEEISAELARAFKRRGIEVLTGAKVEKIDTTGNDVKIALGSSVVSAEKLLVAVGRKPNTDGLAEAGIALTERGFVQVEDGGFATSKPGVYAIGDVIGRWLLAHSASAEGIAAVEAIARRARPRMNYAAIPSCVYCEPQVGSVGLTEAKAKAEGYDVKTSKFNFTAVGRALCEGRTAGFVKVVCEAKYKQVLGVHIIGHWATELIGPAVIGRGVEVTAADIAHAVLPHPTFSEALMEAARSLIAAEQ